MEDRVRDLAGLLSVGADAGHSLGNAPGAVRDTISRLEAVVRVLDVIAVVNNNLGGLIELTVEHSLGEGLSLGLVDARRRNSRAYVGK